MRVNVLLIEELENVLHAMCESSPEGSEGWLTALERAHVTLWTLPHAIRPPGSQIFIHASKKIKVKGLGNAMSACWSCKASCQMPEPYRDTRLTWAECWHPPSSWGLSGPSPFTCKMGWYHLSLPPISTDYMSPSHCSSILTGLLKVCSRHIGPSGPEAHDLHLKPSCLFLSFWPSPQNASSRSPLCPSELGLQRVVLPAAFASGILFSFFKQFNSLVWNGSQETWSLVWVLPLTGWEPWIKTGTSPL